VTFIAFSFGQIAVRPTSSFLFINNSRFLQKILLFTKRLGKFL
jgi:hypothetical protein